ncbi:MAG TPA: DUF6356 family protein [Steroidobacteraceae bacterium]|nr:DUF6356 family protein [Steroidobacteraceae bacterium]
MSPIRAFTEHPASVGESYGEHMGQALCFGSRMVLAGLACLVHGVLPFLFVRTGSRTINELNERMVLNRRTAVLSLGNEKRLPL